MSARSSARPNVRTTTWTSPFCARGPTERPAVSGNQPPSERAGSSCVPSFAVNATCRRRDNWDRRAPQLARAMVRPARAAGWAHVLAGTVISGIGTKEDTKRRLLPPLSLTRDALSSPPPWASAAHPPAGGSCEETRRSRSGIASRCTGSVDWCQPRQQYARVRHVRPDLWSPALPMCAPVSWRLGRRSTLVRRHRVGQVRVAASGSVSSHVRRRGND
jgi:hypothetical protein